MPLKMSKQARIELLSVWRGGEICLNEHSIQEGKNHRLHHTIRRLQESKDSHSSIEQQESAARQEEERETKNYRPQRASSHQEGLVFDGTAMREQHRHFSIRWSTFKGGCADRAVEVLFFLVCVMSVWGI